MEDVEGQVWTTEKGHNVEFRFELVPGDMKWVSCMSGELNNCSTYFSPYANVNQANKTTINGSIGGEDATWQPWEYKSRLAIAKKVERFKKGLKDPDGKQRGAVTKHIAELKSRQEFIPPLGKYVDCIKAEPLHNTNNGWQRWFLEGFTIAMQYTEQSQLKSAIGLSDLPEKSPLRMFTRCLKETVKTGRLCKSIQIWFSEGRKKNQQISYRFTGLESKRFSWCFAFILQELLNFQGLSKGSQLKIYALAYIGLQLRDAAAIYSQVAVEEEEVLKLRVICQNYFIANKIFLREVSPTVWTIGYVIPYHTKCLYDKLGYGLGLNSMQGREPKHIQLAKYLANTCNVNKNTRWAIVFRHEYISRIWLREMDPYNKSTRKETSKNSYIPNVSDEKTCYCSLPKSTTAPKCGVCSHELMEYVIQSVKLGQKCPQIVEYLK